MSKGKGGRPSKYREDFPTKAFKLCLLGATDAELADFFEVAVATVHNWKNEHPEFLDALKRGKSEADAQVAQSLYRRALGYKHRAVKITTHAESGYTTVTPYTERYAPDTVAAIFWLKNRRPDLWRDKQNVEHSGELPALIVKREE